MNRLKRAYAQCRRDRLEHPDVPLDTRNHALLLECLRQHDTDGALRCLRDDLNDFGRLDRVFV